MTTASLTMPSDPMAARACAALLQRRDCLRWGAAAAAAAALSPLNAAHASAQHSPWPQRPLRLVVGYGSGSSPDVQARLLAAPLAQRLGQPVVVENKPGAAGNLGAEWVAKSTDGHTLGVISNGPLTSSAFLYPRLPYNPSTDLAPLVMIGCAPLVLVGPAAAATDPRGYVAQLQASGHANYGSVGVGSGGHLGLALIVQALQLRMVHIPYNGGPAVANALLGGHIQLALLPVSTVMPLVRAGQLTALAISARQRSPLAMEVPALSELGIYHIDIEVWNAVVAPSSMPVTHRMQVTTALGEVLRSSALRHTLMAQGWRVDDVSAKALATRMQLDARLYGAVIAQQGIRLDEAAPPALARQR